MIVGGGKIGLHKARKFHENGANIVCLSLSHDLGFEDLDHCLVIQDHYHKKYLDQVFMVVAATDNPITNSQIYKDANEKNLLCMTTDSDSSSDYNFMATAVKDNLSISVSTDGRSPSFAKEIANKMMGSVTSEDFLRLELLGEIRDKTLKSTMTKDKQRELIRSSVKRSIKELERLLNEQIM